MKRQTVLVESCQKENSETWELGEEKVEMKWAEWKAPSLSFTELAD